MTVEYQIPFLTLYGNGGNQYSFTIPYRQQSDIFVYKISGGQKLPQTLGSNYKIKDGVYNDGFYEGGRLSFIIPITSEEQLLVTRKQQISQPVDSIDFLDNLPLSLENSFDLMTSFMLDILAQIKAEIASTPNEIILPNPAQQLVNKTIITDGTGSYKFSPQIQFPTLDTQVGYIWTVVKTAPDTYTMNLVPSGGLSNAVIPQPSTEYRNLTMRNGAYVAGETRTPITSGDINVVEVYDGIKWTKVQATGISNPVLPNTGLGTLVRETGSNSVQQYNLVDDSYKSLLLSNCVESGCNFIVQQPASILISDTTYIFMSDSNAKPEKVTIPQTVVVNPFGFNAGVGYIYANRNGSYEWSAVEDGNPYGNKILIAEVESPNNNAITYIQPKYIFLPSFVSSLVRYSEGFVNRVSSELQITINTTTRVLGNNGGLFYGFNSNINNSKLTPHQVSIPTAITKNFVIRNNNGTTTAPLTAFSLTESYESAPGVYTPMVNNQSAYFPIFIYPNGSLQILRPKQIYNVNAIPSIDTWLDSLIILKQLRDNASLCAVILLQATQAFGTNTNSSKLIQITNFGTGQALAPATGVIPTFTPAQVGENVIVNSSATGVTNAGYKIPNPSVNENNKVLGITNGAYTKIDIGTLAGKTEPTALLNNCVLNGMNIEQLSAGVITVASGSFMLVNNSDGIPATVQVINFAQVDSFSLNGASGVQYLNINSTSTLSLATSPITNDRGDSFTLAKLTIDTNGVVKRVKILYPVIQNISDQVQTILKSLGVRGNGQVVTAVGANQISVTSGTMTGYDINAGLSKSNPHSITTPPQAQCIISFFNRQGIETTGANSLPAVLQSELTLNTLANLPANKVGFFPIFMFKNGSIGIQYTQTLYDTYDEVSTGVWLNSYKFSDYLLDDAILLGVMKYKQGQNFTNGNSITMEVLNFTGATTTLPPVITPPTTNGGLPSTTSSDSFKILTTDVNGSPVWEYKIDTPSSLGALNGKVLIWENNNTITAGYPKVPEISQTHERNIAMVDTDNSISQINGATDYFTPNIWASNFISCLTGLSIIKLVNKGVLFSDPAFKVVNILGAPTKQYASSELFKKTVSGGTDGLTTLDQVVTRFNKFNVGDTTPVQEGINIFNSQGLRLTESNNQLYDIYNKTTVSEQDSLNGIVLQLKSPQTQSLALQISSPDAVKVVTLFDVFQSLILDFDNIPKPWKCTVTVKIPGYTELKNPNYEVKVNNTPQDYTLKLNVMCPSDTPPTQEDTNLNIVLHNNSIIANIDFTTPLGYNKTFTFTSDKLATGFYYAHDQNTAEYKSTKINLGFSFPSINDVPTTNTLKVNDRIVSIPSNIFTIKLETFAPDSLKSDTRLELGNIATITTYTGSKPALTAGKIRIILIHQNFLNIVSQSIKTNYLQQYKGLIFDPFDAASNPTVALEEQTGTDAPTNSIVATACNVSSQQFMVYDMDVTQAQLDNWKFAVRFKNTDPNLKGLLDDLRTTVCFVNLKDL